MTADLNGNLRDMFPPSTHKQENKTVSAKVDVPAVSSDYGLFRSRRA